MPLLRLLYRTPLLLLVIILGSLATPFVQKGTMDRSGLAAGTTSLWHRLVSRALGIRVHLYGQPSLVATLYVANHISWFDIIALGGRLPLRFLSKAEVKDWPVFGWLASRAGTLYIKRGAHGSKEAIITMSDALRDDQNVCLFPEGTTTDGHTRRFHGRLMQCAIDNDSPIQPVAIYYPPPATEPDALAHPSIQFIGEMTLVESLLKVLSTGGIQADIYLLEPIPASGRDRDELASYCESAIRDKIGSLSAS